MKKIILGLAMFFSLSSFATNFATVIQLLGYSNEVIKLEEEMSAEGMSLVSIKDVYLENDIHPKCPCDKFEIIFKGGSDTRSFIVSTEGFVDKKITIRENN